MGLQKDFMEYLNAFSESSLSEKDLNDFVSSSLSGIWRHGLSDENVAECLKILLADQKISKSTRKSLLQSLVPKKKLSKRTINVLLLWVFSNIKYPHDAVLMLHWLSVMIQNNLIDSEPVDHFFNQLLMCLFYEELTGPVCDVLINVVKPGLVSRRSVFIVQYYCSLDIKLKDKRKVLYLQRLLYDASPALYANPPVKATAYKLPKDKFSECVAQFAFQNKFLKTLPDQLMQKSKKTSASTNILSSQMPFNPLEEITGMKDLAMRIGNREISLVDVNSIVGSKEGLMYLCWYQSMGWGFPEEVHCSLEVIEKLVNVCRRVKSGLNFISPMMSGFLLGWDGEENHEAVYELISWMHFESFEDLYKNVLYYIVTLYLSGTVVDKVRIIYALTKLIANKVTIVSREATVLLISLVSKLIKIGLCGCCLQSTMLLMASVRFYKYLSFLEERYMIGTWTIAPPYVVFGAVFSDCFVLISEVSSLIVRYNTVMLNKFTALGLMEKFEEEEAIIKTYLRDLALFLWEGQATKTELMGSVLNESVIGKLDAAFDSVFSVKNHSGITPLVSFLALQLGRDPESLNEEDLMKMFAVYCEGLIHLKAASSPPDMDSCIG